MDELKQNDKWRLGLHLMPPGGWLNDPNGLCQFNGEYHFFFQYSPDNPNGAMKYWGHYIGKDLLNWEFAGIALSPEEEFESNGVYSGSALIAGGKMNLFYTGNVKLKGDYNYITDGRQGNTVLVSSEDGRKFDGKECLMTNADYPQNLTCHVRDPKVVSGESIGINDGATYMFLGARTKEDVGEVLMYRSENLKEWTLASTLKTEQKFGFMWECPDAFMLEERKFLSISPQGVEQCGINFQNLYQSGYYELEGDFDGDYQLKNFKEWDRGFDFYAPQTFVDEQGRRLLIGWVGMPDEPEQTNPTVEYGWQNAMTVPREVFLKDGKVMQYPVEELNRLFIEENNLDDGEESAKMSIYNVDIQVEDDTEFTAVINGGITLNYRAEEQIFTLSFNPREDLGYGRKKRSVYLKELRQVRMLVDTSCIEIYLNGGEEVFTSRFYTKEGESSFHVAQGVCKVKYQKMQKMIIKGTGTD